MSDARSGKRTEQKDTVADSYIPVLPATAFIDAECGLSTPLNIFLFIYQETGGKPCKGCAYDAHGSRCAHRVALFPKALKSLHVQTGETVRDEAARLGISISEVRRRRRSAVLSVPGQSPTEATAK